MRGATRYWDKADLPKLIFQSTHPMRGATDDEEDEDEEEEISIHAPHAGCD